MSKINQNVFISCNYLYYIFIIYVDSREKNPLVSDMFETDKKWALNFKLKTKSSIFIHSYEESSGWDFRSQFVWDLNDAVDVLISMKQTYTTDDARQLSIK